MDLAPAVLESLQALSREALEACDAVLTRIWTMGRGDLCASCPMRVECPDQTHCLHLAVSDGVSRRTDGPFRRFPLGARRVGRVPIERVPYVERGDLAQRGLAEPAWLALHGVKSFAAVPIGASGQGVLAVFSRRFLTDEEVQLLALAARAVLRPGSGLAAAPVRTVRARGMRTTRVPASSMTPELVAAPERRTLDTIQREAIERVLAETRGRISGPRGAATVLGLKPSTLVSRMQKLGVRRPQR